MPSFSQIKAKDPYGMKNVLNDVGENLAKSMNLVKEKAEELGIDLTKIEEEKDPDFSQDELYLTTKDYAESVDDFIKLLRGMQILRPEKNILYQRAIDSISHSQFYVSAKVYRALNSLYKEIKDKDDDLNDSKTSAFFAYVALLRNCECLMPLIKIDKKIGLDKLYLKFSKVCLRLAAILRKRFFPKDD